MKHVFKTTLLLVLSAPFVALAQMDRHPELKSRAVAWTEYDGSFLIDNTSRAEVFDFYWSVMRAPYPAIGWTGSLTTQTAGTTADAWRYREYAQLNAYRALSGLNSVEENTALLPQQQQGTLVFALNNRLEHRIDSTWIGYTEEARIAAGTSSIALNFGDPRPASDGYVDGFVHDAWSDDPTFVGHRKQLLDYVSLNVAMGGALRQSGTTKSVYVAIADRKISNYTGIPSDAFAAYPGPGFFPKALLAPEPSAPKTGVPKFRWSFQSPWEGSSDVNFGNCVITATRDGQPITVVDPRKHSVNSQWTWEFASADIPATGDTAITIRITGAIVKNKPVSFEYTVTLFDESVNTPVAFHPTSPLLNISTRGTLGAGDRQMIAGFVVTGTLPVRVLVRAQGPSLAQFGIINPAKRPHLYVYDEKGNRMSENSGWKQHPNWRLIQGLGLNPSSDDEPAMVLTLWPGMYTAILSEDQPSAEEGVTIIEAFNIDNETPSRFGNLSTRGVVGTDQLQLIAGIITKDTPRTYVIRTQGPTLSIFGVSNPVQDTKLRIVRLSDGVTIASNDDWQTDAGNARLKTDLSGYAPLNPREAALVITLPPGNYTALVEAKGAPGVGIVEVFDVQ